MKITRVGMTADGGSHFEDVQVDLADAGPMGRLSESWPATTVVFRENDLGTDLDWHCAPQRQLVVLLDGEIEVEVTSGEIRRFRGGDVLLVEDTAGTGHCTRTVSPGSRHSLFIPVR